MVAMVHCLKAVRRNRPVVAVSVGLEAYYSYALNST